MSQLAQVGLKIFLIFLRSALKNFRVFFRRKSMYVGLLVNGTQNFFDLFHIVYAAHNAKNF